MVDLRPGAGPYLAAADMCESIYKQGLPLLCQSKSLSNKFIGDVKSKACKIMAPNKEHREAERSYGLFKLLSMVDLPEET